MKQNDSGSTQKHAGFPLYSRKFLQLPTAKTKTIPIPYVMTLEVPLECNCTEMDKNHLEEAKVNSTLGERESSMSGRKKQKPAK
jgi:hypothetical protein